MRCGGPQRREGGARQEHVTEVVGAHDEQAVDAAPVDRRPGQRRRMRESRHRRGVPRIRPANRAAAVCSRARRGTRLSCRSPCSPAAPPPGRTASPTTPATSSTPCATRAPTSSRWRWTPGRWAPRGPHAACARCGPSWCTSSSPRRPSASRRGSGCCPTPSARPSSPRCTSTAGGRHPAGCRRRCGRRSNGGGRSTARPGGSPRPPPPSSRRTPGTPRPSPGGSAGTTVTIPLAPNVPDCGPVDARAVRARHGIPADAQVVAFFGFVHPVKGLRYLIEAVARLRRRHAAPAPAPARRLHLARPARPRGRRLPRRAGRPGGRLRRRRHRDDHRPPARRRGLGRPARRRRRRVPVHRGRHDEERRAALGVRARPPDARHGGGPAGPGAGRRRRRWSSPTGCATPTRWSGRSPGCSTTPRCAPAWRRAAAALAVDRTWPRIAAAHQELYATVRERVPNMPPDDAADAVARGRPARRHRRPGDAAAVAARAGPAAPGRRRAGAHPRARRHAARPRPGRRRGARGAEGRASARPSSPSWSAGRPDLVVSTTRYDGIAEEIERRVPRSVTDLWRRPPPDEPVAAATTASSPRRGSCAAATRHRGST